MATQTSFYVIVLSISLASIFFFKVNSTEITSFSIPKFVSNPQNLIFQGDTYASNGKLTLTTAVKNVVGRALYSAPIHIWDNETGSVADFTTSFTFVIDAPRDFNLADGLAFFIAPVDTKPQSGGEYLGVFNRVNSPTLGTVAVEFDTYYNREWDPSTGGKHIGINVNSIRSKSYKGWSLRNHARTNVMINFNAATNVLNVNLTYPNIISYTLSDVVPLKDVVPEWVRIGFSATTGAEYAAHEILSWSFYSELAGTSSSNQVAAA